MIAIYKHLRRDCNLPRLRALLKAFYKNWWL